MSTKLTADQISAVFDQYKVMTDQMYDMHAVNCDIVYIENKNVIPSSPDDNLPDLNSINSRRRNRDVDHNVADDQIISVEVSESGSLRIYWNSKDWATVYGYTDVPDNHVMFLSKVNMANKLNQAKEVRYLDDAGVTHKFTRASKCKPWGLDTKQHYCSSIWEHVE